MEIYLIRHGDREAELPENYNYDKKTMDPALTAKGIEQARRLAERCEGLRFDAVYCSDLKRAVHTAAILNERLKTALIRTEAFREIDVGELNFKTWDDYKDLHNRWILHNEDIAYPGGENGEQLWSRCKAELDIVLTKNYERIAIVCHGGTIRSIICGLLGFSQQRRFYLGHPPLNCAISILKSENGEFYLHTFNDDRHLA